MEKGKRKAALITGASGGIGKAIALRLAEEGWDIGIHYRSSRQSAEEIAIMAEEMGVSARLFQAEAADISQMRKMVRDFSAAFGRMDALINNVGVTVLRPFLEVDEALMDQLTTVDFKTPYFTAQEAAKSMIAAGNGGVIINITSVQQQINFPEASIYGSLKAALAKLTEHMAVELAPYEIRINAIAPGYINTSSDISPRAAYIQSRIPLQRLGKGADIAAVAAFLISEQANYITGANIAVDGGMPLPSAADNLYTSRVLTDKMG